MLVFLKLLLIPTSCLRSDELDIGRRQNDSLPRQMRRDDETRREKRRRSEKRQRVGYKTGRCRLLMQVQISTQRIKGSRGRGLCRCQ